MDSSLSLKQITAKMYKGPLKGVALFRCYRIDGIALLKLPFLLIFVIDIEIVIEVEVFIDF